MHVRLLVWSLRHRRWRNVINAVAVIVTAAVVMMFVSVMVALLSFVHDSASSQGRLTRIVIFPRTVGGDEPVSLTPLLQGIDGAKVVQRFRYLAGRHESGATYQVVGEEETGLELNTEFFPVEPAVIDAWKKEKPLGAVVTDATARDLHLAVGDVADVQTSAGPLRVKVVGLSHNALVGQRIAVHYEYLQEFTKNPGICRFRVFTEPEDFERVASAIDEKTRNSASPVQAVSMASLAAAYARRAGIIPAILGFLGVLLIIVTALTLANNCAISVRERRTETATLRVLGYHRGVLTRLLLSEAMLVGLAGGLCAAALCYLIFRDGVQLTPGVEQLLPPVTLGLAGLVAGIVVSVAVPLAGALPSALASMRTPVVEALRDTA